MNSKTQHYIKSAWTNFRHNKWYTSLMVLSLSAGMFCFVLASIYVKFEYSRNSNHKQAERVYRIMLRINDEGRKTYLPLSFSRELSNLYPQIESINLLDRGDKVYLSADGEDYFLEKSVYYTDSEFFNVFTFPLKFGNVKTALEGTGEVVISSRLSSILFNDSNPVGERLIVDNKGTFMISGVMQEVPANSLLYPGILFSRNQLFTDRPESKDSFTMFTHVKLADGTSPEEMETALFKAYESLKPDKIVKGIYSENLADAYWGTSHYDYGGGAQYSSITGANKKMIKTVAYVSVGVLICAFIGYLSLSLGLSLKRAKEIGIRKVNGANKSDIKIQLLSESVFYALLSLLITIVALELTANYFTAIFKIPMALQFTDPLLLFLLPVFAFSTGVLAGIYPAFVVSKLNPVKVLNGYNSPLGSGFRLKQALLVGQFSITIVLVFGVVVQQQQIRKMLDFDFGYRTDDVVAFDIYNDNIHNNYQAIIDEIGELNGIKELSGGPFPAIINGYSEFILDKGDTLLKEYIGQIDVLPNFFEFMQIPIVAGQSFLESNETSLSSSCIVNESFAKQLGGDVIGTSINFANKIRRIIGVARNHNDWGINTEEIDPRVFLVRDRYPFHSILIKHDGSNKADFVAQLETIWRRYERVEPPNVTDLEIEEDYYTTKTKEIGKVFSFLAVIVLVLSLLNLLGVSLIFAGGKMKNISIRRILGAQTIELFFRLSKPFLVALVMSLLVALPFAYCLMRNYLNDFVVRIQLGMGQSLVITGFMLLSLFAVIGFQMLRISKIDPVEVLRKE